MKYIITESQSNRNLIPMLGELLSELGMDVLCKTTGMTPNEVIDTIGLKGTKKDIIFLTKSIFENDIAPFLTYCKYVIIPTQYSMDLVVYIPKPAPEHEGRYIYDEGTRSVYRDVISKALYKFGGGLIRGHNIEVHNTGDC
jgi:hypothetical protein